MTVIWETWYERPEHIQISLFLTSHALPSSWWPVSFCKFRTNYSNLINDFFLNWLWNQCSSYECSGWSWVNALMGGYFFAVCYLSNLVKNSARRFDHWFSKNQLRVSINSMSKYSTLISTLIYVSRIQFHITNRLRNLWWNLGEVKLRFAIFSL